MPMDNAVCFDLFMWRFGLGKDIQLQKTSEQPDLAEYYNYIGSLGSAFMNDNGSIYITIHDLGGATTSTWYEELMHAKQYLDRGQLSAGFGGTIAECEVEVATCLLKNAGKLQLTVDEIERAERALNLYRGGD